MPVVARQYPMGMLVLLVIIAIYMIERDNDASLYLFGGMSMLLLLLVVY